MTTNTISDELQLTTTLDAALTAFRRAILPLRALATRFEQTQLQGDDSITVPYYPLETGKSKRRAAGGSYKALATNTDTQSRKIYPNRNRLQAISFTSEERVRQPRFDPVQHGRLKGEKLALDVIADIWGVLGVGRNTASTLTAMDPALFDEADAASLAQKCMEDDWPATGRNLLLNPSSYFSLVQQAPVMDYSQSNTTAPLREAQIPNMFGFEVHGSNGVTDNNLPGTEFAAGVDDVITLDSAALVAAEGPGATARDVYQNGDQVQVATDNTLPTGLSAATNYYVIDLDPKTGTTFKLSATPGGAAVDITGTGTGTHTMTRKEDLFGAALSQSAILAAFAPIPPTAAIRDAMFDYRIVEDGLSGAVLEYRHFADPDTDEEVQVIECHYGRELGEIAAAKLLVKS